MRRLPVARRAPSPVLDQPPVAKGQDARGEGRDLGIVGDDHERDATGVQRLEQRHDLESGAAVERAGRFVGEDGAGFVDQRARDRDALLLAAGEFQRRVVEPRAEAERVQHGGCAPPPFAARDPGIDEGQGDVLHRRGARQQVEGLEDEAELAVAHRRARVGIEAGDVLAVEAIAPARRLVEQTEQVHEGRFARSRRAHDGDELAMADRHADTVEGAQRRAAHRVDAREILDLHEGAPGCRRVHGHRPKRGPAVGAAEVAGARGPPPTTSS
jgi:hypothetical protein